MSKQKDVVTRIAKVLNAWKQKSTKAERLTSSELDRLVKEHPRSLAAEVAMSPFAYMLASPLRLCLYHNKVFPRELLVRLSVRLDRLSNRPWAYPTSSHSGGRGFYVRSSRRAFEDFQKEKGHKRVFRDEADYPHDMLDKVTRLLRQEALAHLKRIPVDHMLPLTPHHKKPMVWQAQESPVQGFQCILIVGGTENDTFFLKDHSIRGKTTKTFNAPCYDARHIWSPEELENTVKLGPHTAFGIVKSRKTVPFAVALWRYREFIND